ncbi:MAG: Aspartyl/glutamyl-tRNA(Asn/Gln) amidotransferase subunit [Candidatus Saccharibacteria bacterium]|nr:Aspartyl/glutamyl-tRNA(Asn/Gln) amidotransferase subunit [Candidatus Saccharibacteria bacterium]
MANLTREDILKLAKLSRLKLSDAEVEEFTAEISEILQYVQMLDDVDTTGLKPTYQVTGLTNVSRPDEISDYGISQEDLLKNLPARDKNYIKVRKML